jgi:ABC-type uncharacterized transport system involved in gliding motility auxiliary subunit
MFDYIEVTMPLPDWNLVPLAGWYIMQGAVTFLAHVSSLSLSLSPSDLHPIPPAQSHQVPFIHSLAQLAFFHSA